MNEIKSTHFWNFEDHLKCQRHCEVSLIRDTLHYTPLTKGIHTDCSLLLTFFFTCSSPFSAWRIEGRWRQRERSTVSAIWNVLSFPRVNDVLWCWSKWDDSIVQTMSLLFFCIFVKFFHRTDNLSQKICNFSTARVFFALSLLSSSSGTYQLVDELKIERQRRPSLQAVWVQWYLSLSLSLHRISHTCACILNLLLLCLYFCHSLSSSSESPLCTAINDNETEVCTRSIEK